MRRQLRNCVNATGVRRLRFATIAVWTIAAAAATLDFGRRAAGDPPSTPARAALVHKVAEDFEEIAWVPASGATPRARPRWSGEPAPDVRTAKSLKIDVAFSGDGFRAFHGQPRHAAVDSRRRQERDASLQSERQPLRL